MSTRPVNRNQKHGYSLNFEISHPKVRVLSPEKNDLGILELTPAIRLAQDRGLDLVLIAPLAQPPVCWIQDIGKVLYEESKKHKDSKGPKMKEIYLSAVIDPHDLLIKVRQAEEFLYKGMLVRVGIQLRFREVKQVQFARDHMHKFLDALTHIAKHEGVREQGRSLHAMLHPVPEGQRTLKHQEKP